MEMKSLKLFYWSAKTFVINWFSPSDDPMNNYY